MLTQIDCEETYDNSLPLVRFQERLRNIGKGNQRLMQFTAADCLYQVHKKKTLSSPLPTEIIHNILSFSGSMKVTKEGFAAIRDKHSSKYLGAVKKRRV